MTLPASGAISFNAINVELGVSGTTTANINQTSYRNLAGVPSGTIALSNFYGKANQFAFTIASNQVAANLRTLAVNAGWNQASKVVATINAGVMIYSNSTGTPALTINGSFPGGVELVNSGTIQGYGGNGGGSGGWNYGITNASAGAAAGGALLVQVAVSIQNNNRIAGGGGGGGGGGWNYVDTGYSASYIGGGGGGGGLGGNNSAGGPAAYTAGTGTTTGQAGGAGTLTTAGSGGASGVWYVPAANYAGAGGAGGSYGANGSAGASSGGPGGAGGSGGYAVSGNSNVTWLATGTRNGSIS